jgi:membrane-bound lytic murein transglycosylase A
MFKSSARMFLLLVPVMALFGCPPKEVVWNPPTTPEDPWAQLPPGQLALRKITDPEMIPDFSRSFDDRVGLVEAIENSLNYLSKPSSEQFFPYGEITHEQAVASLHAFLAVIERARTAKEFDDMLLAEFDVYQSVGYDREQRGKVLFTGYYRPIFDARLIPDGQFRYPLYRQPAGLEKNPITGETLGIRTPDGQLRACYTRAQITRSGVMRGNELCWLKDPFEAYIVTVQGSGKLRLADGSFLEIGYTANNGYDYVSIGQKLVDEGKLSNRDLSLQGMVSYFKSHPTEVDHYLTQNPRYVFFDQRPGGPYGSLNEPVLPYRSIATDKSIFPRACLAFAITKLPANIGGRITNTNFRGFTLDQDTGGAIRAAGRCDIFMGTGDQAGELAGRTFDVGRLYYLFVKPTSTLASAR